MNRPGQLAFRRGGAGKTRRAGEKPEGARGHQVAAGQPVHVSTGGVRLRAAMRESWSLRLLPIGFCCGSSFPDCRKDEPSRHCRPALRPNALATVVKFPNQRRRGAAVVSIRARAGSGAGCRSGIAERCCYAAAPQPDPGPMHTVSLSKGSLRRAARRRRPRPVIAADARGAFRSYALLMLAAVAAITAARLVWLAVQPADLYPDEAQYWFWATAPGPRLLLEAAADRLADRADNVRLRRRRVRDPPLGPAAARRRGGVCLCDRSAAL